MSFESAPPSLSPAVHPQQPATVPDAFGDPIHHPTHPSTSHEPPSAPHEASAQNLSSILGGASAVGDVRDLSNEAKQSPFAKTDPHDNQPPE